MLVLSRKPGQRVRVLLPDGTPFWVSVTEIRDGKVWLGFESETYLKITREELVEADAKE